MNFAVFICVRLIVDLYSCICRICILLFPPLDPWLSHPVCICRKLCISRTSTTCLSLQILSEVLHEVQPELFKERRKSSGHAPISGKFSPIVSLTSSPRSSLSEAGIVCSNCHPTTCSFVFNDFFVFTFTTMFFCRLCANIFKPGDVTIWMQVLTHSLSSCEFSPVAKRFLRCCLCEMLTYLESFLTGGDLHVPVYRWPPAGGVGQHVCPQQLQTWPQGSATGPYWRR